MPSLAYDQTNLILTLYDSDIQSLTENVDQAFDSIIQPAISEVLEQDLTRGIMTPLLKKYCETQLLVLQQSNKGFGVRVFMPWISLVEGNPNEFLAQGIRRKPDIIKPDVIIGGHLPYQPIPGSPIPLTPLIKR